MKPIFQKNKRMIKIFFPHWIYGVWIFLAIVHVLYISSCTKKVYQVAFPSGEDNKYDTEFPYRDGSKQLREIGETVKRVNCIAYYKSYVFNKEDELTLRRLPSVDIPETASSNFYYDKTSSGTATVIYRENDKIALLTCAHIVNHPDTVIIYFSPDSLQEDPFIQSVSVKREQQNWVPDLPVGRAMKIIHMDVRQDIAVLGMAGIRSDKIVRTFEYPYGNSSDLEWGSFVYLFGYPIGNKMITRAIVSNPRSDGRGQFLIDASFNRGMSGGIVLAIRDGVPNFELVGMAQSISASNDYVLHPQEKEDKYTYDPNTPYQGESFVRLQSTVHYGVTHVISIEAIKTFFKENKNLMSGKGYYFYNLFKR